MPQNAAINFETIILSPVYLFILFINPHPESGSQFHKKRNRRPSQPTQLLASMTLLSVGIDKSIDVKTFFMFFLFWSRFFYVFNIFLFSKRFFIFENVGKVQSGKQINKKHFQNNSNEIDL